MSKAEESEEVASKLSNNNRRMFLPNMGYIFYWMTGLKNASHLLIHLSSLKGGKDTL